MLDLALVLRKQRRLAALAIVEAGNDVIFQNVIQRLAFDAILRRDYTTILGVLFFASLMVVVANIITANAKDIDYVDLRYSNGFTIGWDPARAPASGDEEGDPAMLASRGNR